MADHSGEVSYTPRYLEIEQALRKRLTGMAPGDALPSDVEIVVEDAAVAGSRVRAEGNS